MKTVPVNGVNARYHAHIIKLQYRKMNEMVLLNQLDDSKGHNDTVGAVILWFKINIEEYMGCRE